MSLSRDDVLHIARLARLEVDEDAVDVLRDQLSGILAHFAALAAVDTTDIEPTAHTLPLFNVMRTDEVSPSLATEQILANAPDHDDGYLRVRAVLE